MCCTRLVYYIIPVTLIIRFSTIQYDYAPCLPDLLVDYNIFRLSHILLFDDIILFLKPGGILSTILCFISQVCRFNLEENDLIQWGQIRQTVYLFWLVGYTIFRFYHSLMVIICFSRLASSKKCCSPLPMSAENGWCFTLSQITLLKRKEIKQPVHYADCLPDLIVDYNVIQIFLFSGYKLFLKTWGIHSTVSGY